ncbi:MAG TPA: nucleotidyltransferase family protein [Ferruginibacter sp.]|nr:nucleotidyltransferase family protein [Ferruginibacter sp.]HMP19338.1 nucleotidyltransferase family protein [Ferruginibacter sp.]
MTACILLAAGNSSRMQDNMGTAPCKLLLPFNNSTLLQHAVSKLLAVPNSRLFVVTGCYHQQITEALQQQQLQLVFNDNWQQGIGSSIQKGIQYIQQHFGEAENVLITVSDQPGITTTLIHNIIQLQAATHKGIVGCTYADTTGTPVLFHKKYFTLLEQLTGHQGAKKIMQEHGYDAASIDFPEGATDIDTPEDYRKSLLK